MRGVRRQNSCFSNEEQADDGGKALGFPFIILLSCSFAGRNRLELLAASKSENVLRVSKVTSPKSPAIRQPPSVLH